MFRVIAILLCALIVSGCQHTQPPFKKEYAAKKKIAVAQKTRLPKAHVTPPPSAQPDFDWLRKAQSEQLEKFKRYLEQRDGIVVQFQTDASVAEIAAKKAALKTVIEASRPVGALKGLQTVYFATNRTITPSASLTLASITNGRDATTTYGSAIVTIPKSHKIGVVERPSDYWIWEQKESEAKHFTLRKLEKVSEATFREIIAKESPGILLFVHGYRVPFEDAIYKTAQIAFDANFRGEVVAFSWPSAGALLGYAHDDESAKFSSTAMFNLLKNIRETSPNKKLFLVAHSMGSQIVTEALRLASFANLNFGITELVLAAPDVDRFVFQDRAAAIRKIAGNVTIYASSADRALLASHASAWQSRIGYVPATGPHLLDGYEIIDVTAVGEDMFSLNHSVFSGSRSVLDDLGRLLVDQKHPPHMRSPTLEMMPDRDTVKYWRYPK